MSIAQKEGQALIDSLRTQLTSVKNDTNKVNILNKISEYIYKSDTNQGLRYAQEAYSLAKKLNWEKGVAVAIRHFGDVAWSKHNYNESIEYYFQAFSINEKIQNKYQAAKNLSDIGWVYGDMGLLDKGLEYLNKALQRMEEIHDKKGQLRVLDYIQRIYSQMKKSDEALECSKKCLKIVEELGNTELIYNSTIKVGGWLAVMSNYSEALKYYFKGLKIVNELKDSNSILERSYLLRTIGTCYEKQANYPLALEYYYKAMKIAEDIQNKGMQENIFTYISNVYTIQEKYNEALEILFRQLKKYNEIKRNVESEPFSILYNIGNIYSKQKNPQKALEYHLKCIKIIEKRIDLQKAAALIVDMATLAESYSSAGNDYTNLKNYSKALEYYFNAMKIQEDNKEKSGLASTYGNIGKLYYNIAIDKNKKKDLNQHINLNNKPNLEKSIKFSLKAAEIHKETGEIDALKEWYGNLAEAYVELWDYKNAFQYRGEAQKLKDSIFSIDKIKKIANLEAKKNKEVAEKDKEVVQKALEIQKFETIKARNEGYLLYGGLAFLAIIIIIIYNQRKTSEKLLLNILPAKIAKRLKRNEKLIADRFEEASVIFIDQVSFTEKSQNSTPEEIVGRLNDIYTEFDILADKYGLEKIKTIGDCYMAAAGIPEKRADHAEAVAKFAIEAMKIVHNKPFGTRIEELKSDDSSEIPISSFQIPNLIELRCGIDCGPVVAGVIGKKKFIYDLWGDTVNTASRMEDYSEPGKIQVTERFREKFGITDEKLGINFEERGEIEIKGKGKMKTYYMEKK
jgi:class 3 adenylate cyclase/tetratricopeptide (TPR) repeat protein